MAISLKHSTLAVGAEAGNGEIGKTQWNEDHALTMGTGKLLGRSTAGDGAVEEITLGAGLALAAGELTASGAVGGSNTQVQFNDGGAFGGDAGLTFNKTSKALTLGGATVTTSSPVIDAAQTWNAGGVTFTGLKFNATDTASAAGSLLMDLQVGGSSVANINKSGVIKAVSYLSRNMRVVASLDNTLEVQQDTGRRLAIFDTNGDVGIARYLFWGGGIFSAWAADLFLTRRAAANLRFGAADVGATTATVTITIAAPGVVTWSSHGLSTGTPVVFTTTGALPTGIVSGTTYYAVVVDANTFQIASSVANAIAATPTVITTSGSQSGTHTGTRYNITQRLSMQSITGVTNRLGADLFIQGSQGTGTGAGGSIIFQVAPAGSSGTAQNALATALTIAASKVITVADTYDLAVGTSTGTKIGTATTQKLGFWNAAPVVQPTAVADATDAATVITQLNALLAHMRTIGLIAT